MRKLRVTAENGRYDITIGQELDIPALLSGYNRYAVVTDETVYGLYGAPFDRERCIVLQTGEPSKNIENLAWILERLLEMGMERTDALVALGGGVVGDIAGLAASLYKRGMPVVQVPTTLLAQVDSSVGGKTAVNLPGGKNMVGTFYQPSAVYIDTDTLDTLPAREYGAGMAEVVKYALIADAALFQELTSGTPDLEDIIDTCCRIKAGYVERDPYDRGERMQLNYGHTLGHAIESAAGYGVYLHGEAVSIGMVLAARIGEALGISEKGLSKDTVRVLDRYGLPVRADNATLQKAVTLLSADKKAEGGKISFVLVDRIGHAGLYKLKAAEIAGVLENNA